MDFLFDDCFDFWPRIRGLRVTLKGELVKIIELFFTLAAKTVGMGAKIVELLLVGGCL